MRELRLRTERRSRVSRILTRADVSQLDRYIDPRRTIVLAEERVVELHGSRIPLAPHIVVAGGEAVKTPERVMDLCRCLLEAGADRSSFLLVIGGGALTDAAGMAASIFMRGIGFGFVPTTLLSQVDASVGGKNGVNFGGVKNVIGTINQPDFVLCDTAFIDTISDAEYVSGFAEIIKHALIRDRKKFSRIAQSREQLRNRNAPQLLGDLIARSVEIKAAIVRKDETEQGPRRLLNFGHTVGHAAEVLDALPHGVAVGVGMRYAARISCALGALKADARDAIEDLLDAFGYPVTIQASPDHVMDVLMKDKKKSGSTMNFVILNGIGSAEVRPIPVDTLRGLVNDLRMRI